MLVDKLVIKIQDTVLKKVPSPNKNKELQFIEK
jgi:hypothetical protein